VSRPTTLLENQKQKKLRPIDKHNHVKFFIFFLVCSFFEGIGQYHRKDAAKQDENEQNLSKE